MTDIGGNSVYELPIIIKMARYTQEELAEIIGKSPAFIRHVEALNIKKAISLDMLFDIADALDIQPHKSLIFD